MVHLWTSCQQAESFPSWYFGHPPQTRPGKDVVNSIFSIHKVAINVRQPMRPWENCALVMTTQTLSLIKWLVELDPDKQFPAARALGKC